MNRDEGARRDGFTIIEVLAAFVLIALIMPAVAKGISICVRAEAQGKALIEAATLADAKMNELIAYPEFEGQMLSGDFSPEHPEYRWTAASLTNSIYILEVVVVVTWTGISGEHSWSLSTFVYRGTGSS